ASCIGIVANILWVAPITVLTYVAIEKTIGHRVAADDEKAGLDVPEMGVPGYAAEGGREIPELPGESPAPSPVVATPQAAT
ncbi:MAG: ammonium transporter, partial [Polyangiales bacterium]